MEDYDDKAEHSMRGTDCGEVLEKNLILAHYKQAVM